MAIPTMMSSMPSPFRPEDDNNLTRRACQAKLTLDSGSRGHIALAKHRRHHSCNQLGSQLCLHNFGLTQQSGRRSHPDRDHTSKEKCNDFLCQLAPETVVCAIEGMHVNINLTYHDQAWLKVFPHASDPAGRKEQIRQRGNSQFKAESQKSSERDLQLRNSKGILPMAAIHDSAGNHQKLSQEASDKAEKKINTSNNARCNPEQSVESVHRNTHSGPYVAFAFLEDPSVPSCRDVSKGSPSERSGIRREFFLPAFLLWVLAFSLPCLALADLGKSLWCISPPVIRYPSMELG